MDSSASNGRQYRILSVIGKGGFGKVYRGRLEGPEGFFKDVAIKLLKDEDVAAETLQRFRDEARILGLIRDRAIVSVDPPTRLDGRWGVVMEFVDGASAARLLKKGPFPPEVGLEIIEEVCRALDKAYHQPGVDGQPLRLLHRDLKPGNLQITPSGEVKILDFGIARADFSSREALTTNNIAGTIGYIAPERLIGIECAAGDIYSLGVLLHKVVTKKLPSQAVAWEAAPDPDESDSPLDLALALSRNMRDPNHETRPDAKAVMAECHRLARQINGTSLRMWASTTVPVDSCLADDDLVGSLLSQTFSTVPMPLSRQEVDSVAIPLQGESAGSRRLWGALAGGLLVAATILCGLGALWQSGQLSQQTPVAAAEQAPSLVEVLPETPPTETPPDPVEAPPPVPEPAAVAAVPAPAPAPRLRPKPTPEPVAAAPVPEPAQALPTYELSLSSVPLGAEVFVDDESVGHTPIHGLALTSGSHQVRMVSDALSIEKTVLVGRRAANRYVWRTSTNDWQSSY